MNLRVRSVIGCSRSAMFTNCSWTSTLESCNLWRVVLLTRMEDGVERFGIGFSKVDIVVVDSLVVQGVVEVSTPSEYFPR